MSSNHKEQFFLLKADIYETFYIYIGDGINEIHTKFIKDSDSEDIEKIQFPYNYEKISTFYERVFDFNYKENNYLVIKVEYEVNKENKGILFGFSKFYDLKPDTIIELDKGGKVIINYYHNIDSCILVSSYENLKELNSLFDINNFTDIIKTNLSSKGNNYVYIDSSNNKSKIQFFKTDFPDYSKTKLNLFVNNDIQNYFDEYGSDLLFMRMSSHSAPLTFHVFYIYGFKEKYSLYIKKLYGNINFYQYNQGLNKFSNISKFEIPYYHFLDEFNLIKDNFINISGFQIFTFYNSYNSLFDFYFQKENDSEFININSKMFKFNNLVQLLEANKLYYLNFTVDHIIKLDSNFLDSEVIFIDKNEIRYILNKENKVIRNLTGDNVTVKSNKKALIYFYKRIHESGIIDLEFDKTQSGKIMKFNITNISNKKISTNINIIKDFGFSGCYPMINEKSNNKIKGNENQYEVYIENLYDKLTNDDLYEKEGEKLIVFIYPFNESEFEISNVVYINNLMTKKNRFNMEIIPANSNGILILDIKNFSNYYYQFFMCKSKEIIFTIDNSNGNYSKYYINENKQILFENSLENEILIHTFKSDNEFLFSYTFDNYISNPFIKYKILSILELGNNILQIKFESVSEYYDNYYILIARKDDKNNIESFSDICYISKLFISNDFNSIFVKSIYKKQQDDSKIILDDVDISAINLGDDNNKNFVITVVSLFNEYSGDLIKYYEPKENNKNIIKEIHLEEEINFNLEKNYIFRFEYNDLYFGKDQKLTLFFNRNFSFDIYLTYKDTINKKIFNFNDIADFILTHTGKYYLEIYNSTKSQSATIKGTFIAILTDRLIDIIDLSKKEYKNNKTIILSRKVGPNYYIINNLIENKNFKFTFEVRNKTVIDDNPFIVCNNITNECLENVNSYNFTKGNNYTIFIRYLFIIDDFGEGYYYPSYRFYEKDEEIKNKITNDGMNSAIVAIIIIVSSLAFIILIISLVFIFRYCKKKHEDIELIEETSEIKNESLFG